ncbi:MAG: cysteine synthase A [Fibromonadaceae bacterium]|jgi:cysteine synthase A|nr:cysteine synthase A [Fibromonadaceae bacterium]
MVVFSNNAESIGNTPLVRLNRVTAGAKATVLAKIEARNPTFSVKCRIGTALINDAEERGVLKPGMTIVEPTSGNTGIALAYAAVIKGYELVLTMPETMSLERRKILTGLGAHLELTSGTQGMKGAIAKAEELQKASPDKYFIPQQFENPANPAIHEKTTGPEIWEATNGGVDVLVAGVGTGGTISGISRFIKKHKKIISVAVEPEESPVITQTLNKQEIKPAPHKIQGIGAGFIPKNLELSLIDKVEVVSSAEAMDFTRRLMREEGIFCGISSGAAVAVALRFAHLPEYENKTIVAILPDTGERYLSTELFSL